MPLYTKPYLTIDQQIALLQSRGMQIDDVAKAKECLARIGYYRLSAYWYPFRQSTSSVDPATGKTIITILDDFRPGTPLSLIHDLYVFDKQLRMITLDALERVEIGVRNDVALLLGQRGSLSYRDHTLLHGNFARRPQGNGRPTKHKEWLDRFDKKFQESREDFAKHFKSKYPGDHLPIWMAVELWDFGTLSHLFGGLTISDQDKIAAQYGNLAGNTFATWLRCLNDIRNICAHHSRLWNRPLSNQPTWPALGAMPEIDHLIGDRHAAGRLYAPQTVLKVLLRESIPRALGQHV